MRKLTTFLILILACSCSSIIIINPERFGKVEFQSKVNFAFQVSDEYALENQRSSPDQDNPQLSKAEARLLIALLRQKQACIGNFGKVEFRISSKQDAVYDTTFLANQKSEVKTTQQLKSTISKTYFGRCTN